jgi:ethanolamine utilization microcompartment shell protein EutL
MASSIQIISHPGPGVFDILMSRMSSGPKKKMVDANFSSVGLVQGKLVDMMLAADIAEKAADVQVYDLKGSCPQHLTMIGIFGDIAAVKAGVDAIQLQEKQAGKKG